MSKAITNQAKPQKGHKYVATKEQVWYSPTTGKRGTSFTHVCSCGEAFELTSQRHEARRHMVYPSDQTTRPDTFLR